MQENAKMRLDKNSVYYWWNGVWCGNSWISIFESNVEKM